jgi:hypothetical protein
MTRAPNAILPRVELENSIATNYPLWIGAGFTKTLANAVLAFDYTADSGAGRLYVRGTIEASLIRSSYLEPDASEILPVLTDSDPLNIKSAPIVGHVYGYINGHYTLTNTNGGALGAQFLLSPSSTPNGFFARRLQAYNQPFLITFSAFCENTSGIAEVFIIDLSYRYEGGGYSSAGISASMSVPAGRSGFIKGARWAMGKPTSWGLLEVIAEYRTFDSSSGCYMSGRTIDIEIYNLGAIDEGSATELNP